MRENLVKSMAMQVKAQIHEESKFWSTSQPFAKPIRDVRKKTRGINPTTNIFVWLCKISHTMRNHLRQPKDFTHHANFAWYAKSSCALTLLDFYIQIFCVISQFLLVTNLDIFFYIYFYISFRQHIYKGRERGDIMYLFH